LQYGTKIGAGFLVPGNGWYIFGGVIQTGSSIQVQSLSSIGSTWALNSLTSYNGVPSFGHCSVQVRNGIFIQYVMKMKKKFPFFIKVTPEEMVYFASQLF
jgi:hypothetical protein